MHMLKAWFDRLKKGNECVFIFEKYVFIFTEYIISHTFTLFDSFSLEKAN